MMVKYIEIQVQRISVNLLAKNVAIHGKNLFSLESCVLDLRVKNVFVFTLRSNP